VLLLQIKIMPRHIESSIQQACVRWFRLQYPELSRLLFAVPNGGARGKFEAVRLKAEGVVSGVSDILFLYPSGKYHCLCIEFKTKEKSSKQRESQIEWQKDVESVGNMYVICRSFEQFRTIIETYLQ
jgi:hypothetical protein